MSQEENFPERERRDWVIILFIVLFGLLCVILAGGWAIRFSPTWSLNTDMGSNIDPNSDFLTNLPGGFIEPLDPSILTQPAWINVFLTPSASFETSIPATPLPTNTPVSAVTFVPTTISTFPPTPTNTFVYIPPPPPTNTPKPKPPPSSTSPPSPTPITPTNTPTILSADLQITKDNGVVVYEADDILIYSVTVTNNGPGNLTGAVISDNIPVQIATWDWTCTTITNASGCDGVIGSNGNFTDTIDIQNGGSIVYTVTANISTNPSGNLVNLATVTSGINDPVPGNNSAMDTDELVEILPYGNLDFGLPPDGNDQGLSDGESLIIALPSPGLIVNGDPSWDLIYFEQSNPPGIQMDRVILQIGDGSNWYTVLNWGDGVSDYNTNIAIPLVGNSGGDCSGEPDNCVIDGTLLSVESGYPTGITIDVDGLGIPAGAYPYLRILVTAGGDNDGVAIDGFFLP